MLRAGVVQKMTGDYTARTRTIKAKAVKPMKARKTGKLGEESGLELK
jgi:hypothetical protein